MLDGADAPSPPSAVASGLGEADILQVLYRNDRRREEETERIVELLGEKD